MHQSGEFRWPLYNVFFLQFDSNRFDFIWSVKSEQTNLFLFNQNKPIFFCLERINCRSGHFVWMESCFGETRFLGNSGKTISRLTYVRQHLSCCCCYLIRIIKRRTHLILSFVLISSLSSVSFLYSFFTNCLSMIITTVIAYLSVSLSAFFSLSLVSCRMYLFLPFSLFLSGSIYNCNFISYSHFPLSIISLFPFIPRLLLFLYNTDEYCAIIIINIP
jgi:hypothetical protein